MPLRIIVADDHELVRAGLRSCLTHMDPEVVILDAASLDEAITHATTSLRPDFVILDLRMPGMNGGDGIAAMRARLPGIPVLVISGSAMESDIRGALRHGAAGYVLKTMGAKAMINAFRLVLSGETYIPALALDFTGSRHTGPDKADTDAQSNPLGTLTPREREILSMLGAGKSNKEIARSLALSEVTVKAHVSHVLSKLGVPNRTRAARLAIEFGLTGNDS